MSDPRDPLDVERPRKGFLSGEPKWLPGEPVADGVEAGSIARLPGDADPPVRVYINGVLQHEGHDYFLRDREILFTRPIIKEGKLSRGRWMAMYLGLFGSYKKNEIVDIEYYQGENVKLANDVPLVDDTRPESERRSFGGPGINGR